MLLLYIIPPKRWGEWENVGATKEKVFSVFERNGSSRSMYTDPFVRFKRGDPMVRNITVFTEDMVIRGSIVVRMILETMKFLSIWIRR